MNLMEYTHLSVALFKVTGQFFEKFPNDTPELTKDSMELQQDSCLAK